MSDPSAERNEAVEKVARAVAEYDYELSHASDEHRDIAQAALDAISYEATLAENAAMREWLTVLRPTLERAADRESGNCVHPGFGRETDRCPRCCARRICAALDAAHREEPT